VQIPMQRSSSQHSMGFLRPSASSKSLYSLDGGESQYTDGLERGYNEPSTVPHCRERMYDIAQVIIMFFNYLLSCEQAISNSLYENATIRPCPQSVRLNRIISRNGTMRSKQGITTEQPRCTLLRTSPSFRRFLPNSFGVRMALANTSRTSS
jgi:hypothetical protein